MLPPTLHERMLAAGYVHTSERKPRQRKRWSEWYQHPRLLTGVCVIHTDERDRSAHSTERDDRHPEIVSLIFNGQSSLEVVRCALARANAPSDLPLSLEGLR
jgi:hypothetical protein